MIWLYLYLYLFYCWLKNILKLAYFNIYLYIFSFLCFATLFFCCSFKLKFFEVKTCLSVGYLFFFLSISFSGLAFLFLVVVVFVVYSINTMITRENITTIECIYNWVIANYCNPIDDIMIMKMII